MHAQVLQKHCQMYYLILTHITRYSSSVVKAIADAVSSIIVQTIRNDTEITQTIASNLINSDDFSKVVVNKLMEKTESLKQEIYESLSFDNNELSHKVNVLEESYNQLK